VLAVVEIRLLLINVEDEPALTKRILALGGRRTIPLDVDKTFVTMGMKEDPSPERL
jgi:hypothetical protein